jgi:hypothetical protein
MVDVTYTAELTREGRFWLITIDGVGVTQALNLGEAEEMATSLIEIMTGDPEPEVELVFGDSFPVDVKALRHAQATLTEMQERYSASLRQAVRELTAINMTGSDVAKVLQVSPQRISQINAQISAPAVQAGRSGKKPSHAATRQSADSARTTRKKATKTRVAGKIEA